MTNEEIEQKIIELEREIHLARRAWRIDYNELTERLDFLGGKEMAQMAKDLYEIKKQIKTLEHGKKNNGGEDGSNE